MSESAFWYWDELKKNVQTKGGLFDTQPSLTPSNICNVEDVPELATRMDSYFCVPGGVPKSFRRLTNAMLPYYLATLTVDGLNNYGGVSKECIDCREYKRSSHILPEFWKGDNRTRDD